jgi:hypothetical protein
MAASDFFVEKHFEKKEELWVSAQYDNSISVHTCTRRNVKVFKGSPQHEVNEARILGNISEDLDQERGISRRGLREFVPL